LKTDQIVVDNWGRAIPCVPEPEEDQHTEGIQGNAGQDEQQCQRAIQQPGEHLLQWHKVVAEPKGGQKEEGMLGWWWWLLRMMFK
jgi:hypothetical protein